MYTQNNDIPYSKQMFADEFGDQKWNLAFSEQHLPGFYHIFEQHEKELVRYAKIRSNSSLPKGKSIYTTTNIITLCKNIVSVETKYH